MKLAKLSIKGIKPEHFHNQRSYEAALYAIEVCNYMIHRSNRGDIIFEFENFIRPEFEIEFDVDGVFTGLFIRDGEHAKTWLVGDVTDTKSDKIYCTKSHVREYFKLWRVAKIYNVNKVTDLTKY